MRKLFKYVVCAFVVWFIVHTLFIIRDGIKDEGKTADIALVLGNKVNADGTLSERLEQRLTCGISLYRNKRVKHILVSGGLGKEGFYEGDKMKAFLVANGVPDTAIIVDNKGNNTIASVENTLKLKDSLNFNNLIVVSQYYHVSRTKMLFRKRHFTEVSSASPNYFEWRDLYSLTREFFAYYVE